MSTATNEALRADAPTAIVTGGGTGIGFAVAEALVEQGYYVMIVGRRLDVLEDAARRLSAIDPRGQIVPIAADMGDPHDIARVFEEAGARYGRLDALVTAAAALHVAPFHELTEDNWTSMIDVILNGAAFACMHAARIMRAQGGGRIVLIGSVSGEITDAGLAHYSAAKAGLHSLARGLAVDLSPFNITANAIAPGWVRTPMISDFVDEVDAEWMRHMNPMSRAADPSEIANVVRYLIIDAPTFLTGATIPVDGGQTAMNHHH